MIFETLRGLFLVAERIYFREVTTIDPPPDDVAGRLFAANHWNGIVDPLVILAEARFRASPLAKAPLFSIPVFKNLLAVAEAVPVVRRRDTPDKVRGADDSLFDKVAEHLAGGGNVLIFPEGTSHDEPTVLPLKSGAARMLARAHELGARGLSLQAVALDFDARDRFRSRAVITYGPVHAVDALVSDDKDASVKALTEAVAADLDQLVITGESRGEVVLIREVAQMLAHEEHHRSLASQTELARAVIARGRALGHEDPRYRAAADAVEAYRHARLACDLTDEQVARGNETYSLTLTRLARGLVLLALAPLALVGALLYAVPYRLPRVATRLAKGEVDVVSTYKLAIGLVAFPLWLAGLIALAMTVAPASMRALLAVLVVVSPFSALAWLDRIDDRRGLRLLRTAFHDGIRDLARLRLLRRRALDALFAARGQKDDAGDDRSHG